MIVEHSFITTRGPRDALLAISKQLESLGFSRSGQLDPQTGSRTCANCGYELKGLEIGTTCPECGTVSPSVARIEFVKGRAPPLLIAGYTSSRAPAIYRFGKLRQQAVVDFDRGLISLAASIEDLYQSPETIDEQLESDPLCREYLLWLAGAIETAANAKVPAKQLEESWAALSRKIRRRNITKNLPLLILLGIVVVALLAEIWVACFGF